MIDLDELERLAAQATPGPWFVTCNCTGKTFYTIKNDRVYIGETLGVYNGEANAAYIVAACNAVPELIARVRELERQKRVLVEKMAIDILCSECPVSEACPYENATFIELEDCAKQLEKWSENAAKEAGE